MKKSFRFLFLFLIGISIFSCKDDDDEIKTQDYFDAPQPDSVFFKTAAGEETITLKTNLYVTAEVPTDAASWCEVEFLPIPPRIIIKTKENLKGESRSTNIILKAEQFQHKLYVEQLGQSPAIRLSRETYRVGTGDTCLLVTFVSNITPETKSLTNWISCGEISHGEQTDTLRLNISSTEEIRRMGEVEFSYQNNLKQILHIIQQSSDTTYKPASADNLFSKVAISRVESTPESNELEKLYDGNTQENWQQSFTALPIDLDFYFDNTEVVHQMIYYPGLWPTSPLEKFEVYVQYQGEDQFHRIGDTYDFQVNGTNQTLIFPQPIKKPQIIRLHLLTAKEMMPGKYFLSAGEFEFYKQNINPTDIFTDITCSELKQGVTYEQITAIEDDFIRNLARHLYAGTYDSEFRVQEYLPYANPDIQKADHVSRAWGFLDNVTGINIDKNEPLVIFVGDTHGETVGLYTTKWETDQHPDPKLIIPLSEGLNLVNPHEEGFLYITYFTDQPENKEPIKIHIPSGKVNGYFDITKPNHDNAYWQNLLAKRAQYKYLDVKGKFCHLNFLVEDFLTYCPTDIESLISGCDSVIYLEHELSGVYKYKTRNYPNRMLCRYTTETGNFLAHASDYFTCYIRDAVKGVLNVNTLKQEPWAIAHELGHVHQNRNITWEEMTEVSNNVFSLYVQTAFGNTSRLYKDNVYQSAYDELAIQGKPYNNANEPYNNYFTKLVPLWQLQLYFSKVLDNPDFYPDLYEAMRKQGDLEKDKDKFLNFMKLCCETGKQDLTEFFRFFGLLTPTSVNNPDGFYGLFEVIQEEIDQTVADIASMSLPKPQPLQYLTDGNIKLFREKRAIEKGSVQLNGNILTLNGWQNAVAYEVRKAGKLIQISQKDEFTLQEKGSDITVQAIAADGSVTSVDF